MRGVSKRLFISLLTVFMVCLIASTATTTVTAAPNWGTLKAGDEMQWQSTKWGTVKMKVLNVEGKTITIDYEGRGDTATYTIDADASIYDLGISNISPWLTPKSMIEEDYHLGTQNYEWQSTSYKAYYDSYDVGGGRTSEDWYDFNTGILFEHRITDAEGNSETTNKLVSTNADLAEASGGGGCLGTILIALISVTAIVSYGLVRNRVS